ncbi:MAG TPA: type III-B CRISPR module-associated protein Cmr5 [Vicinamibacterales bacterium]|nr:type III-B CRISPR module-associated protein Cmr5 [Vicinamibacterales bacterium]
MPTVRTLDQERAAYAWQCVAKCSKDYVNLVKGAPALIMSNGLMQALAYYQEKSQEGKQLVSHVGGWLRKCGLTSGDEFSQLMQSLHGSEAVTYMRATTETIEVLKWIKQVGAAVVDSRSTK